MLSVGQIEGSPQWQAAVFLFAGAFILLSAVRGWGQGLLREATGIVALFGAGFLILLGTSQVEELLRRHVPAWILLPVAAGLIWVVSYNSILLIGKLLFPRTRDFESTVGQLVSGLGGAAIGVGYGLLFVFGLLVGIKVVGRIAQTQAEVQQTENEHSGAMVWNLARLKKSVELGFGRTMLDLVDPLPRRFYRELDQYSRIIADPSALQKLLEYPGLRQIWESPGIVEIERDPEIVARARRGDFLGVFTNPKVLALLNDSWIRNELLQGDIDAALNYALTPRTE